MASTSNESLLAKPRASRGPSSDVFLAFAAKAVRTFSYGAIAPIFFAFCIEAGLSERRIGALLTAIMLGDLCITLWLTTRADVLGRRRTLTIGAVLKMLAAVAFVSTSNFWLLVMAGIVGVISTSGGEIGTRRAQGDRAE
jgi:MFS family permease